MYEREQEKSKRNPAAKLGRFEKTATYPLVTVKQVTQHLCVVRAAMVPGAHAYVFLPSGEYFEPALRALVDDGWTFNGLLAWDKAPFGGFGIGSTWRTAFEPVARLSNGPSRNIGRAGAWPTVLRQRPTKTRTSKPPQLYQVFIEASTKPGELVVDPYCGLDPLQVAAKATGREWRSNDVLTPEEVEAQARDR